MRLVVRTLALAALVVAGQAPDPLQAQAFQGPREPRGFDFRPDGAWRKQAKRVREARQAAITRGDLRLANSGSASMSVTGDYKLPVVFVNFADTVAAGFQLDTAAYGRLFFSADPAADSRPYSLKTFYEELSNSNITIDGDQYGWIPAPATFTKAYVGQACHAVGVGGACTFNPGTRFGAWLVNALDSLNSATLQVDWAQYDHDNDGTVDFVTFIHPTIGGECSGLSTSADIWAHRWSLSSLRGTPYVTKTPWPGHAGQFIRIDDYIIQSSRGGNSGCTSGSMMPVGTMAHETGHAFGLPDLYATAGNSEGVGEWSLMGSGNYSVPKSPGTFDAWSLVDLGWVAVRTISTTQTVTLNPVQTSDTVVRISIPGTDEYLLLENRAQLQSDTAQMDAGRPLSGQAGGLRKQSGLLIWHIDQSVVDGGRGTNSVNAGAIEGVHLAQADGLEDLHNGINRGDVGDSYPGGSVNHTFSAASNPAAVTNNGTGMGFTIDSIFQVSPTGAMVFRFVVDTITPVAVTYDQATSAILGITPLTTPQSNYLDDVGNNNGIYDLGDYLAYLKANAIVPAPGVLERVGQVRTLTPARRN